MTSNGIKLVQLYPNTNQLNLLIAFEAVDYSLHKNVIVISKDTDLFLLSTHHYRVKDSLYLTSPEKKNFKSK